MPSLPNPILRPPDALAAAAREGRGHDDYSRQLERLSVSGTFRLPAGCGSAPGSRKLTDARSPRVVSSSLRTRAANGAQSRRNELRGQLGTNVHAVFAVRAGDLDLEVRRYSLGTQQYVFDLRRKELDALSEDQVVRAPTDATHARERPPARAR